MPHKARFLTDVDPGFELFETLRVEGLPHQPHAPLRAAHLARLARSAHALGFAWVEGHVTVALDQALGDLARHPTITTPVARLRLSLNQRGAVAIQGEPLPDLPPGPARLSVSPQCVPNAQPLAAYKTTLRSHYDAAVLAATAQGLADTQPRVR